MEHWIDIKGYEGKYKVSNLGRIKSLERIVTVGKNKRLVNEKILNPIKSKNGYLTINFTFNGRKQLLIHRLVAQAFFGDANGLVVNHKDFDKTNNIISNLEYCTQKENMYHSCIGEHNGRIVLHQELGIYYYTLKEAANVYGFSEKQLHSRLNGKVKNNSKLKYA